MFLWACDDSRHTDESSVSSVEEGSVEDLQDEGEVLQRKDGGGGTHRKQHTLQRRQRQRQYGCLQVCFLFTLSCIAQHFTN